jgi:MoaD family protein
VSLSIKFVGALRHLSGKTKVTLPFQEGISINQLLERLCLEFPEFKRTFSDQPLNHAKSNSLVLVNGREIGMLDGYDTKLNDGNEIVLVPVVHGG